MVRSGKMVARDRASNDADVSTTSPIIPYGGFTPVRLEGWPFRQRLPHLRRLSQHPAYLASRRFASVLRVLRGHTLRSALCQNGGPGGTPPCEELSPLPQRPSLRSGLCCPGPSSLNRPHAPHSRAHPDFAAMRFIRDAFAVLVRLGDPASGSVLSLHALLDMPSSATTGSRRLLVPSSFTDNAGLRLGLEQARRSQATPHPLQMGRWFSWFTWFTVLHSLRPVDLLALLAELTGDSPGRKDFYFRAFDGSVSLPAAGYDYGGNWAISTDGTFTRWNMPISIAAPKPSLYETFIHYTSPVFTGRTRRTT